ncbi:hypothetical protein BDK51DRAFT_34957 [Blyttiomyces helicus]|uniref:SH3 domain-containing protein n=1 Tax=Blyttiomyces helicus TaxID=388810 RepID=A0A4P9WG25_9FUNG|nr:hypothetical protein BDK51DRAFT_34957 [Blyttiomyces helicus]|eukprot:RKO89980.1 hypothetical protein BDK51DRAFT_34957 [Blyttiomyces helicus]
MVRKSYQPRREKMRYVEIIVTVTAVRTSYTKVLPKPLPTPFVQYLTDTNRRPLNKLTPNRVAATVYTSPTGAEQPGSVNLFFITKLGQTGTGLLNFCHIRNTDPTAAMPALQSMALYTFLEAAKAYPGPCMETCGSSRPPLVRGLILQQNGAVPNQPVARYGGGAAGVGRFFVIAGGWDVKGNRFDPSFHYFDTVSQIWQTNSTGVDLNTLLPPIPSASTQVTNIPPLSAPGTDLSTSSSSGIPVGAIAGGVAGGIVILCIVAWFLLLCRWSRKGSPPALSEVPANPSQPHPEVPLTALATEPVPDVLPPAYDGHLVVFEEIPAEVARSPTSESPLFLIPAAAGSSSSTSSQSTKTYRGLCSFTPRKEDEIAIKLGDTIIVKSLPPRLRHCRAGPPRTRILSHFGKGAGQAAINLGADQERGSNVFMHIFSGGWALAINVTDSTEGLVPVSAIDVGKDFENLPPGPVGDSR